MEIASIEVGTDATTGLPVHRRQLYHRASTIGDIIQVFYNEFLMANGNEVLPYRKNEYHYCIKDVPLKPAIAEVLDEDGIVIVEVKAEVPAHPNFTNWCHYVPTGQYNMLQIITGAINNQLGLIPLDAPSGYIING